MTTRLRTVLLGGGALAAGAMITGFLVGTQAAENADWHAATVEVVGEPEHPLVSFDVGGWTYSIDESLAYWIDREGVHHGGWPTCLSPSPTGTGTQVPRKVPIRFATVDVEVEDVFSWRQVVAVDCRPTA